MPELALRQRPLLRHRRHITTRTPGRNLQHRQQRRTLQPRTGTDHLPHPRRPPPLLPTPPPRKPHYLHQRPARPRPSLCPRQLKNPSTVRMVPARRSHGTPPHHHPMVPGEHVMAARDPLQQLQRMDPLPLRRGPMNVIDTAISDVKLLEPKVFSDERGFFFESFNQLSFAKATGRSLIFLQDNHSCSKKNTLRGLHYQLHDLQAKLVRVVAGEVYDVAVDLRHGSPNFGQWVGFHLSAANKRIAWIPEGFAHGFLALTDDAQVLYKASALYNPSAERSLRWDDPSLAIAWPLQGLPFLSTKDANAPLLSQIEPIRL